MSISESTLDNHSFLELTELWKNGSQQQLPQQEQSPTEDNLHTPDIKIHRNGDIVQAIEFQCTCGKSAIVYLKYDGD